MIQKQFPDLVIGSGMSDAAARKIVELCRSGLSDPRSLGRFWFSRRLQQIEESVFLQMIDVQMADNRADVWNNAVHMFHTYYLKADSERGLPEEKTLQLLTWLLWDGEFDSSSLTYYWSKLAAALVAQYPKRTWEFFTGALRLSTKQWSMLVDLDTNSEQVLTSIMKRDPVRAWQCVAEVYSTEGEGASHGLRYWLSEGGQRLPDDDAPGPIQFVPPATIFAWVDQNVEDRAYWLIDALPKTMDTSPGGRLTREFVVRYGTKKEFECSLRASFHSRAWCGPTSEHYRLLRRQAHEWLAGEKSQTVISWIEDYIDQLSAEIQQAEIEEERRM